MPPTITLDSLTGPASTLAGNMQAFHQAINQKFGEVWEQMTPAQRIARLENRPELLQYIRTMETALLWLGFRVERPRE